MDKQTVKQTEKIRDRERKKERERERERDVNCLTRGIDRHTNKQTNKQKEKWKAASLQINCRIEDKKLIIKHTTDRIKSDRIQHRQTYRRTVRDFCNTFVTVPALSGSSVVS